MIYCSFCLCIYSRIISIILPFLLVCNYLMSFFLFSILFSFNIFCFKLYSLYFWDGSHANPSMLRVYLERNNASETTQYWNQFLKNHWKRRDSNNKLNSEWNVERKFCFSPQLGIEFINWFATYSNHFENPTPNFWEAFSFVKVWRKARKIGIWSGVDFINCFAPCAKFWLAFYWRRVQSG